MPICETDCSELHEIYDDYIFLKDNWMQYHDEVKEILKSFHFIDNRCDKAILLNFELVQLNLMLERRDFMLEHPKISHPYPKLLEMKKAIFQHIPIIIYERLIRILCKYERCITILKKADKFRQDDYNKYLNNQYIVFSSLTKCIHDDYLKMFKQMLNSEIEMYDNLINVKKEESKYYLKMIK